MTSTRGNGSQSPMDDQSFHDQMRAAYEAQGSFEDKRNGNDYHVQAKLPGPLYSQFWQLLRSKGWSKATGVKYAIYKLINEKS